jgi:hypothetical protein
MDALEKPRYVEPVQPARSRTAEEELLTNQRVADQMAEQRLLTTIQLTQARGGGWQDSTIYTLGAPLPGQPSALPAR